MNKLVVKSVIVICIALPLALGGCFKFQERSSTDQDTIKPVPFPSPPNNPYGTYEPSMTADQKTIYFAMFPPPVGDPDPDRPGKRDIYVSHKIGDKWTEPKLLPAPINSPYMDTEPMISSDGRTLNFMSNRPGGMGKSDLYISRKKADSDEWGPAESMGHPFNTKYRDHCLILTTTTNGDVVAFWTSTRRPSSGKGDIWASRRLPDGKWSEAWNVGPPINNAKNQCRFVPGKGNLIGIVTDHGMFQHADFLVRFDQGTKSWAGPRISAGWNSPGGQNDGCGNFTTDGKKFFWSSGRDLPPRYKFPARFKMYWLDTEVILTYYEDKTGISVR